jgi:hypothetical protein
MRSMDTRYLVCALLMGLAGCFSPSSSGSEVAASEEELISTPSPITGGTLAIAADGFTAVASDPERHRVSIVDLKTHAVHHVLLNQDDLPGRVAIDAEGRAHVVLAGSGMLASIDLDRGQVISRREACGAPAGVAYDATADVVHVACQSGQLVTFQTDGGDALRSVFVEPGLRDVLVHDGQLQVTTLKSARVITLDSSGVEVGRRGPAVTRGETFDQFTGASKLQTMRPAVAWRSLALGDGRVMMLHQRGQEDEIQLGPQEGDAVATEDGGMVPIDPGFGPGGGSDPYGGSSGCGGIVQTAFTMLDENGEHSAPMMGGVTMGVDAALSPDGRFVAVAVAGSRSLNQGDAKLEPGVHFDGIGGIGSTDVVPGMNVMMMPTALSDDGRMPEGACMRPFEDIDVTAMTGDQATAVAFDGQGQVVVQTREPAAIVVYQSMEATCEFCAPQQVATIELGGDSVAESGHDMFHRNAGAGIACASCHPGGGDDGLVWTFSGMGPRRSQAVHVGLAGTEPFHWDGDMTDLSELVHEVFENRMGGEVQSPDKIEELADFLFALQPPTAIRQVDDSAVTRGQHLFESTAGCADCHAGSKMTDSRAYDVGTGGKFQVPSLVGIGYRAPFIHTGCAETLRDRFDPACGGERHGNVAGLEAGQIDDLVAYLESL